MSVLSSISSARLVSSPKTNGYAELQGMPSSSTLSPPVRTPSYASVLGNSNLSKESFINVTPEELFTKQTIAEVKAVQKRLKADADAKQEELRLMVGERYRDLLQASSSIISIGQSSGRVLEALEESRNAILSQSDLPLPPKTATGFSLGAEDQHLFALQALSAHVRVLLDAPEHLWRFIERKRYLQAAWLFLLARVVHRALVTVDENEEPPWVEDGVDVQRDFPLVQRQWEVVSQFRSQIIHKSMLSLREITGSAEDVCATLVTLHLLDSRPLVETLSTFLQQRSKTLQTALSWNPDEKPGDKGNKRPFNGIVHSMSVREVAQRMKDASNVISRTINTARTIFDRVGEERALIFRVLTSIQDDRSTTSLDLPSNLRLSTQTLLTQLTSSAIFQTLPHELRSYKPYIDLDSTTSSLAQNVSTNNLQEWFSTSCQDWERTATTWVACLSTVKDLWTLRTSFKRYLSTCGLEDSEKSLVSSNTDRILHKRVLEIWQQSLDEAEKQFKASLIPAKAGGFEHALDPSPVDFLFTPPPIPVLAQNTKSFIDAPLQKYQSSLKRQLAGRTSQLDTLVSILEQCARTIQSDLAIVLNAPGESTSIFHDLVFKEYQPYANTLTAKVVKIVSDASKELKGDNKDVRGLILLARVSDVLHSGSSFSDQIGCDFKQSHAFKEELRCINDDILERWRHITVQRLLDGIPFGSQGPSAQPTGSSPPLLQGLLTLHEDLVRIGVVLDPIRHQEIVRDTLGFFVQSVLEKCQDNLDDQTASNLALLWKISDAYGQPWSDTTAKVHRLLESIIPDTTRLSDLEAAATGCLARSQTMLSVLLPIPAVPKFDTPLLQFGVPSPGQNVASVIDLAKPTPRFGMLLVGNSD